MIVHHFVVILIHDSPDLIIRLEKEKQELKDEVLNLKRQIDDMEHRKEEIERIMRKLKKQS